MLVGLWGIPLFCGSVIENRVFRTRVTKENWAMWPGAVSEKFNIRVPVNRKFCPLMLPLWCRVTTDVRGTRTVTRMKNEEHLEF